MKVLITGSTFWNPGDDAVRHGAMALFEAAVRSRGVYEPISWFLYSFSHPRAAPPHGEHPNLVRLEEVYGYARKVDHIIVPGLAVGAELDLFFERVAAANCGHKLIFIGGMNENAYCKQYAHTKLMSGLFEQARIVIGRTVSHPHVMDQPKQGYWALPCPSIFSSNQRFSPYPAGPALFSIQLEHGHPNAVINHSTSITASLNAAKVLEEYVKEGYSARCVAHHISEALIKMPKNVEQEFYSEGEQLDEVYRRCECVVSTRLHAVLKAQSMGTPSLLMNSTDRHTHAAKMFPHVPVTQDVTLALLWLKKMRDYRERAKAREVILTFKNTTFKRYLRLLHRDGVIPQT